MRKKYRLALFAILALWMVFLVGSTIYFCFGAAVLDPKGWIGEKQRDLLITSTWLMLIVVIPVFLMTLFITWKYRASNKDAKYSPNWENSNLAEALWWGLPFVIIVVLSVITWKSSHELDPFKPLHSTVKPLKIQVVALQWKWLFLYPEEKIATLNFLQFPKNRPINFEITSDAPMNSFWIPQLGGQIYCMPGMRSKLHLIAEKEGEYRGSSANLSGDGFAHMTFIAKATSEEEYNAWVSSLKIATPLTNESYKALIPPSIPQKPENFQLESYDLFENIVMKYMMPMEN